MNTMSEIYASRVEFEVATGVPPTKLFVSCNLIDKLIQEEARFLHDENSWKGTKLKINGLETFHVMEPDVVRYSI